MLSMQGLTKIYRTESVETHALSDLTLEVDEGEFIALMGPSGSGKSTFLNIAGPIPASPSTPGDSGDGSSLPAAAIAGIIAAVVAIISVFIYFDVKGRRRRFI